MELKNARLQKGTIKVIAMATGLSKSHVNSVRNGTRRNEIVEELIQLYFKDRLEFAKRVEKEVSATKLLESVIAGNEEA